MPSDQTTEIDNPFKIRLEDSFGNVVVFDATPDLIETRNTNYHSMDPVHMPGSIMVFKNSSSRSFDLTTARLISRNEKEAERTIKRLWILRGWGMPRFGNGGSMNSVPSGGRPLDPNSQTNPNAVGAGVVGAPPPVLFLSAYSSTELSGYAQHIYRVPVVMMNLSIPYPSDIDYITTRAGVPVPIITTVSMLLTETHSPNQYENFSLSDYQQGRLKGF